MKMNKEYTIVFLPQLKGTINFAKNQYIFTNYKSKQFEITSRLLPDLL